MANRPEPTARTCSLPGSAKKPAFSLITHQMLYVGLIVLAVPAIWLGAYLDSLKGVAVWVPKLLMGLGIALAPSGLLGLAYRHFLRRELEQEFRVSTGDLLRQVLVDQLDPELQNLRQASTLVRECERFGVRMLHKTRRDALTRIAEILEEEENEIVIVGSSLKGLIGFGSHDNVSDTERRIRDVLWHRGRAGRCRLRFLLTHPDLAHLRAEPEGRTEGNIEQEILGSLLFLTCQCKLGHEQVRLFYGAPTIFMVATSQRMIANPYPYKRTSMESFCVEFEKGGGENPDALYNFLMEHHFRHVWSDDSVTTPVNDSPHVWKLEDGVRNVQTGQKRLTDMHRQQLRELQQEYEKHASGG